MPLVPQSTISNWYRKDSWVYKNFTYLFQNQLWDKNVPKGFSLCPYFWLALFSMTFFRLFVGCILATQLLFSPFGGLLEKTDRFATKCGISQHDTRGVSTFAGTALTAAIGGLLYIMGYGGFLMVHEYREAGALASLMIPCILIITLITTGVYRKNNRNSSCKVEIYPRIIAVLAVIAAYYFMPSEFVEVANWVGALIISIAHWIWWFISYAIPHGIAFIAVAFGHCVADFFTTCFHAILWIVGGIIITALAGLGTDKYYLKSESHLAIKEEYQRYDKLMQRFGYWAYASDSGRYNDSYYGCQPEEFWSDFVYRVPEITAIAAKYSKLRTGITEDEEDAIRKRITAAALNTWNIIRAQKSEKSKAREATCNKVTGVASTIASGAAWPIVRIGKAIAWAAKQTWTFICLLWELTKAKKSGACPYLTFTDPVKEAPKSVFAEQKSESEKAVVFGGTQKLVRSNKKSKE